MIAYFDIFSGISGDMTLGALIDLGVPVDWLKMELNSMLGGFELSARTVYRHHLRATDLAVEIDGDDTSSRNYADIREMIECSGLSERVKEKCLLCFERIARAEAGIHGKEIDTVHFHEIGGIDSIVDIVGSFLAVDYLGIKRVYASHVPVGSGFVDCAHGRIPVPVPATAAILKGIPVYSSDATTEIVTPTGAAIIATLCEQFGPMPEMKITGTGYGAGKRETGSALPNLLRIHMGEESGVSDSTILQRDQVMMIETNVDDMTPEMSGYLMETLLEKKALDVAFIPALMKKNRPGTQLQVMCAPEDLDAVAKVILTESSAIGLRYRRCDRMVLPREAVSVDTRFGRVMAKKITDPGGQVRYQPEYEAVREMARKMGRPFRDLFQQILEDANRLDTE